MGGRGVHFALSKPQEKRLLAAKNEEEISDIIGDIEEGWDGNHIMETDKAWDAIHRCLTDGTLSFQNGDYPLNRCILGGRQLYKGDDYIVSFITPSEVRDVAQAIPPIDEDWLKERYFKLDPRDYGFPPDDEDFEYTWENLVDLKGFFRKAANSNRAVIFTVDQ